MVAVKGAEHIGILSFFSEGDGLLAQDKHRAIGERLRRAKSPAARLEVAQSWGQEWYNEESVLLRKLKTALSDGDKAEIVFIFRQLEAVNDKRHEALPKVLDRIAEGAKQGDDAQSE